MDLAIEEIYEKQPTASEEADDGISVPNWLIEVLAWISRMEMAYSLLNSSSRTFEQICWHKLYGNVEPHRVPFLFIFGEEKGKCRPIIKGISKTGNGSENLPIPMVVPPDYITGFDWITICYLDERILQFFKCIAPMLKNCIFKFNNWTMDDDGQRAQMRELILLLANKISMFYFVDFHNFNWLFPELINEMHCIAVPRTSINFEPLFKWLTDKRSDGKQKILTLEYDGSNSFDLSRIKKEFYDSKLRSNFLIWQQRFGCALFTVENEKTGEILELYENKRGHHFLARYPKGEDYWKEEGERKAWPCDENSTWILVDNGKNENWMHASSIYSAFEKIREGIEKILMNRNIIPTEYMDLYALVFNMVNYEQPYVNCQHLYNNLNKIIKKHLQTSIRTRIIESIGSDNFAETMNAIWNNHSRSMKSIFSLYLDRVYVSKTGLLGVYELGMEIFGKEIIDHPPINAHLKATFRKDLTMAKEKIDDSLFKFLVTRINGKE